MWPLIIVGALFWGGGSGALALLVPWRWLDPEDRWLAAAVVLGWPIVLLIASIELTYEQFFPRGPWWTRKGRW